jgi:hypothetical protein
MTEYDTLPPETVHESKQENAFAFEVDCSDCEWSVRRTYDGTAKNVKSHHEETNPGHSVEITEGDGFDLTENGESDGEE